MALSAAIFDVDGVLVASPHERAWREAMAGFADPAGFTTDFYQAYVAGKPRLDGARSALERLGAPGAESRAPEYAAKKQALIDELIEAGSFDAFPDAVRLAAGLHAAGLRLALASSSKNADAMLRQLSLPDGRPLLSIFEADLSGAEVPHGKPDPALFLLAAKALGAAPGDCLVVEDAPAGVEAARAGGMAAVGIARLGDEGLLQGAGADIVVTSLDQVDIKALGEGLVRSLPTPAATPVQQAMTPTAEPDWVLRCDGFNVITESSVESRFALGNGFLGMRSSRSLTRGPIWTSWLGHIRWASWPRCYVAGLFDVPNTDPPVPALVPVADWSRLRIFFDGELVFQREGATGTGLRQLDMRRGLLISNTTYRASSGMTAIGGELRLLSQADRATALQLVWFSVDRDKVDVRVEAEFSVSGLGIVPIQLAQDVAEWRTECTEMRVAMAGASALQLGGVPMTAERTFALRWVWRWHSVAGQVAEIQRFAAVARADGPDDAPALAATVALSRNYALGWRAALAAHEAAWDARWEAGGVVIEGDEDVQRAIRFAVYHLTSAANPDDERVSVGARALTGDAYLGHVFWDTEIYLLPFYTVAWPEAARAMLMYRYRTLPAARAKAARMGFKGAFYAWESADTGAETTPDHVAGPAGERVDILTGKMEVHINADIAYAVWQYWRATGDDGFFLAAGAEIMLETARFWASRAVPEADGKRHIHHVIGPDEYHEDVDDNAFTNVMARWNLFRALETVELLGERWPDRAASLRRKLSLGDSELAAWKDAAARIVTGLDPKSGLYEQFAGFFALEPLDLEAYADRTVPIDVALGRERTQAAQVVKQADVVALISLLPNAFPGSTAETNFRYYEPLCAHGSSLSAPMHALVAARLGDTDMALRYLHRVAAHDPAPDAAGGVRIAALGGLWQAVVLGFGGVDLTGDDMPSIAPKLPATWRSLAFRLCWRGRSIAVRIADGAVRTALLKGEPMDIRIGDEVRALRAGAPVEVSVTQPAL